jgi:hypothetical protein
MESGHILRRGMAEIARYLIVEPLYGSTSGLIASKHPDGEWVRYADMEHLIEPDTVDQMITLYEKRIAELEAYIKQADQRIVELLIETCALKEALAVAQQAMKP